MSAKLLRDVVQKNWCKYAQLSPPHPQKTPQLEVKPVNVSKPGNIPISLAIQRFLTGIAYFLVKLGSIYLNLQLNNLYIPEDIHSLTAKDNW